MGMETRVLLTFNDRINANKGNTCLSIKLIKPSDNSYFVSVYDSHGVKLNSYSFGRFGPALDKFNNLVQYQLRIIPGDGDENMASASS